MTRPTQSSLWALALCALSAFAVCALVHAFPVHLPRTFGPVGLSVLFILTVMALAVIGDCFPTDSH